MLAGTTDVAFYLPTDKWVYRTGGKWRLDAAVNKKSLRELLRALQWEESFIDSFVKSTHKEIAVGHECIPNQPAICLDPAGMKVLNTWVPPTIVPAPGNYSTIQAVLDFFTEDEVDRAAAQQWIINWMAYKVQNPAALPKVAIVFASEQGGGKGFLGRVLSEILGPDNCAIIKQSELGNKFNTRWINKLFVLGDEVLSSENVKDISQLLKILVDGHELEREGKNTNQTAVKSRLAWMFASNDRVSPLVLEQSDRRYSIFTNHKPVSDAHKAAMNACFEKDRITPTEAFRAEIAGFAHHLLSVRVDVAAVGRPFQNAAREGIIAANRSSVDAFCDEVNARGISQFFSSLTIKPQFSAADAKSWEQPLDGGGSTVPCTVAYNAYQVYCVQTGQKPFKIARFGVALKNRPDRWNRARHDRTHKSTPPGGAEKIEKKRVWCYELPIPADEKEE